MTSGVQLTQCEQNVVVDLMYSLVGTAKKRRNGWPHRLVMANALAELKAKLSITPVELMAVANTAHPSLIQEWSSWNRVQCLNFIRHYRQFDFMRVRTLDPKIETNSELVAEIEMRVLSAMGLPMSKEAHTRTHACTCSSRATVVIAALGSTVCATVILKVRAFVQQSFEQCKMHAHKHAHTHTRNQHVSTHSTRTNARMHPCTHARTHAHMHTLSHTCTHSHINACAYRPSAS